MVCKLSWILSIISLETRSASSVCEVGADVGILPDEDPATAYGVDTEEAGRADGAAEEEEATVIELLFAAADVDGTASPIRFEKKRDEEMS